MSLRHNTFGLIGACSPLIVVNDKIFLSHKRRSFRAPPIFGVVLRAVKQRYLFNRDGILLVVSVAMNSPPMQSTSKCVRSDFSIERILSDDSGSSRERIIETPSWLCCTRYRPPRVPRSVNNACKSRRSGRHARVPFTAAQASALEAAYVRAPYLAPPALRALASALQLRDDRIKIWFQNRRARERREKFTNIIPTVAVALPPTSSIHNNLLNSHISWMTHQNTNQRITNYGLYDAQSVKISSEYDNENESSHISCSFSSSQNSVSSEEDRPETPLDIESLEE